MDANMTHVTCHATLSEIGFGDGPCSLGHGIGRACSAARLRSLSEGVPVTVGAAVGGNVKMVSRQLRL